MTKKIINRLVEEIYSFDFEGSMEELISWAQAKIERYGPTARIDYDYGDHNGESSPFSISITSEETDEEYAARLAKEESDRNARETYERQQYEELAKKYGNG